MFDKLYRAVLRVRNRGNSALKCLTTVPPALRGVLEFVPDMFFLQVGVSRDFSCVLRCEGGVFTTLLVLASIVCRSFDVQLAAYSMVCRDLSSSAAMMPCVFDRGRTRVASTA